VDRSRTTTSEEWLKAAVGWTSAITKPGSLYKPFGAKNISKLGALGNATRKKGIRVFYHVREADGLGGCTEFGVIEIRLALTNASDIFRRAGAFRGDMTVFSRDANEGAVERNKQGEVRSDETPEWRRALGARAGAPHWAACASLRTCRLTDPRRREPGRQQACAIAVLYALKENAMETSEADFVQKREQFARRAAVREAIPNDECEKVSRLESDSELWPKQEHLT
jgi:hypothetical protein